MKAKLFAAFLILVVNTVFAADFEVIIDGKTHLFSEGIEQNVDTKSGQQVSITVATTKTKKFQEHGISFRYPSEMKLSQESFFGLKQITLEATDSSLFMVQIFPSSTSAKQVEQDLIAGFRKEFSSFGATFPANSTTKCPRFIGGQVRSGVKLSFSLGPLAHETEVYTMSQNGKTLALVFQHAIEDREQVQQRFAVIAESFK